LIKVGTRFGMELGTLPGIKLVSIIAGEKGWKMDGKWMEKGCVAQEE